jgi:glutaminase
MQKQLSGAGDTAEADPIQSTLDDLHARIAPDREGRLADYIPELARVEPDRFGLALMTTGGRLYRAGDAEAPFTIQSVVKPFAYCLAIEFAGRKTVRKRVGVEPSGDAFNSITFDPYTSTPFNPMVNAGAITIAGLLREVFGDHAFAVMLERLSLAAGRELDVDEEVFRSEALTGHRNRAIGHLLRAADLLAEPVESALDLYFRLCSIRITAVDLANIAATLANIGQNPSTGKYVFDMAAVRDTISVMFSCGMYDYSGNWICDVGIAAKSGVGGGIVGVVNRQLGIGAFSPRLDKKGNSVRGVRALRLMSDELGLHAFEFHNTGSTFFGGLVD